MSSKSGITVIPLAAAISAALAPAGTVQAQGEGAAVLEEIIVTATKREQNLQEIPASIQAIPQAVLEKMGARGIEDYGRFIPSLNALSTEPGSTTLVFRGVNTTIQGSTSGVGQSPASMYLDELPITITGDQPAIRLVDIARIEALSGPQGSLYGGSAQAGTLRIITNQPDPSGFEAVVDVTLKQGGDTAFSHDVSGVLNLPFADGKGAVRLVGFTATDAGFIDNVFGHTPDTHDKTITGRYNWTVPAEWGTEDNADVVEDDWNQVDYDGGRVTLRYDFNDEWGATVGYNYHKTEAHSGTGNHYDPFVGDLQVVKFNDGFRNDQWDTFSLVLEGDLGWAQLVSATSYYSRETERLEDATVYQKYYEGWACNYQWDPAVYTGYFADPVSGTASFFPRYCFGPSFLSDVKSVQRFLTSSDKFAQEFRLSGGSDDLDWLIGLFYEKTNDDWNSPWGVPTNYDYQDSVAIQYWRSSFSPFGFDDPTRVSPNATHGWESISRVEWDNQAIFGEVTWRVNDQWAVTAGARWFDRNMESNYIVENPNMLVSSPDFVAAGGPSIQTGGSSDFVPKLSVSYGLADDKMLYVLYSEGYRPGGTNRNRGNPVLPVVFDADKLENFEVGAKTRWADGRVQLNLTYYDMTWRDYQLRVLDPSYDDGEPWQQVIANVGDATVQGFQVEFDAALTGNLSFGMNLTSITSETASNVSIDTDPTTIEIPSGTRLPLAPDFKAAAWLDYNWETNFIQGDAFARLQFSHTGDSVNQIAPAAIGANPQILSPSYGIMDFRVGLKTDADWEIDFFVSNLTDERAQYTRAAAYFELAFMSIQDGRMGHARIYTNRPREFGIRVSKRWTD